MCICIILEYARVYVIIKTIHCFKYNESETPYLKTYVNTRGGTFILYMFG